MSSGRLVLCATPIGNLEDLSERVVRTLRDARLIACEDTRRTRKLLSHLGLSAPRLVVYNEANEQRAAENLLAVMKGGGSVVLVSDAGMPGLSDPGYRLVAACATEGIEVDVIPGPNAALSALVISGLPPARFVFEGFLPRRSSERIRHLEELRLEERTLVFYESPHRVAAALADMEQVLGERRAVLARELTKMHQEVRRGTLGELVRGCESDPVRGEIVIVIEGATAAVKADVGRDELARRARELMDAGVERSGAMKIVARDAGVSKRDVFDALLDEG